MQFQASNIVSTATGPARQVTFNSLAVQQNLLALHFCMIMSSPD